MQVGYCSDTRYNEKFAEKQQQHQTLKQLLVANGHKVRVASIIRGSMGSSFNATSDRT